MYKAKTFDEALTKAARLVELGGFGHTSVLYTDPNKSRDRIDKFGAAMKTARTINKYASFTRCNWRCI